ncbi:hypothetical protein FQN57_005311 [Myotisia sp. PD_48]|nr:hypothetical protein FQN57_005311 [Myotisia sp. PD_48]
MDKQQSQKYLEDLLNKTLRVQTSDRRLFVGSFQCTDNERNIILANTHEYRYPNLPSIQAAAAQQQLDTARPSDMVKMNMTSRFIGLVVVPGQHIMRIEVDASANPG